MVKAITTNLLELDDLGRVRIAGTSTRITMIAVDVMNGMNAQQIHEGYSYLSLAQIYAALSYYHEHKAEIDAQVETELREVDEMRKQAMTVKKQPTRAELERRLNEHRQKP